MTAKRNQMYLKLRRFMPRMMAYRLAVKVAR